MMCGVKIGVLMEALLIWKCWILVLRYDCYNLFSKYSQCDANRIFYVYAFDSLSEQWSPMVRPQLI